MHRSMRAIKQHVPGSLQSRQPLWSPKPKAGECVGCRYGIDDCFGHSYQNGRDCERAVDFDIDIGAEQEWCTDDPGLWAQLWIGDFV